MNDELKVVFLLATIYIYIYIFYFFIIIIFLCFILFYFINYIFWGMLSHLCIRGNIRAHLVATFALNVLHAKRGVIMKYI